MKRRAWLWLLGSLFTSPLWSAAPLQVVTSLTDLRVLAERIGGEQVRVQSLAQGSEDPHYVEARPSFVRQLHQADVLIRVGLDLESAWLDPLLRAARNPALAPGQPGFIDASEAVQGRILAASDAGLLGDRHAHGNPHYLLNPLNGLRVAQLLSARFSALRPEQKPQFEARLQAFTTELGQRLFGGLAAQYPVTDWDKLLLLAQRNELQAFLASQNQQSLLGGWLGGQPSLSGIAVIDDHDMWGYFAQAFGLQIRGHLEPKPGILPSSAHLQKLVRQIQAEPIRLIINGAYYDPKHAGFLSKATGVPAIRLAHQVQALPEARDYLELFEFNLTQLRSSLERR